MTEGEWLVCTDPQKMLRYLTHGCRLKDGGTPHDPGVTARKLRLLACACHEIARQDSTGILHDEEALQAAYAYADDPSQSLPFRHSHWMFALADAERAAHYAVEVNYKNTAPSLLRCLFGNPFDTKYRVRWGQVHEHSPGAAPRVPSWLTWHDGTVVKLARSIYDSRDFSAVPILADALEEAGCANEDILAHCREDGLHGRGCWVLDLLLGKS